MFAQIIIQILFPPIILMIWGVKNYGAWIYLISFAITEKLYKITDKKDLLNQLSINTIKASSINTWENFVSSLNEKINKYKNNIIL